MSIPSEGLEVKETSFVGNLSHSPLFLNLPAKRTVQIIDVTDSSRPVALKYIDYVASEAGDSYHLVEHYSELLSFALSGKDRLNRPDTISLSSKVDRHGAPSVKSMCDYIIDPHRSVTYALCEHNLTIIRSSADDDAGERLWESTLAP